MTLNEFKATFSGVCQKYGLEIPVNDGQLRKMHTVLEFLMSENQKYNLTAIRDPEEAILKHFCDSACVVKHLSRLGEGATLLDVGSGAGFPALPIAIMLPEVLVTALDATEKKVNFIRAAAELAEIGNVTCISGRAEELATPGSALREAFDCVIARSVADLRVLNELCLPFVKPNGKFYAMKSERAMHEIAESKNGRIALGAAEKVETVDLYVDSVGEKRLLIVSTKKLQTSGKYPRKFAKIKKSPL